MEKRWGAVLCSLVAMAALAGSAHAASQAIEKGNAVQASKVQTNGTKALKKAGNVPNKVQANKGIEQKMTSKESESKNTTDPYFGRKVEPKESAIKK